VSFQEAQQTGETLQIETEPVLETGRFYALVKILGTAPNPDPATIPTDCPGSSPCPSDLFRVQHYNPKTQQFDGVQEMVRIPQQPRDQIGVFASTPRELEQSPAGSAGWYIYGAQDRAGRFTVQALKPRSLFQLQPQQTLRTQDAAFRYIYNQNWKETEQRKQTLQTTLIDLQPKSKQWQIGDRALVMHLFGGRGGKNGEPPSFGTVPGHFSYGAATVIRDPFTQELQWDIQYKQIYGTNVEGIIPGAHTWTNYMGNLKSGWMSTRPVNDVLVQLDLITEDYDFGGIKLSPFTELMRQLSIGAARYRLGDGTGAAMITPATSCVQDSNQALFLTIQRLRSIVESSPAMQQWWASHPQHPTIQRFERLIALGDELERQLTPLGLVRGDWKQNATFLVGTQKPDWVSLAKGKQNVLAAIASWRTILPRQTQDELSFLFLKYDAKLWFLRTNQIGGLNPDIVPIAPTGAFARWTLPGLDVPVVSVLFLRLMSALRIPNVWDWLVTAGLFSVGIVIAGLQGVRKIQKPLNRRVLLSGIRQLFFPALFEEVIFRVLLIPYPSPGVTGLMWSSWALFSLGLFVLYCSLTTKLFHRRIKDRSFLIETMSLGLICSIAFFLTRSIATITVIHWLLLMPNGFRRIKRL
jgi:predicted Abi (CAAX) family protease